MKKIQASTLILFLWSIFLSEVQASPVDFTVTKKQLSPSEIEIVFTGKIEPGWHVYSTGNAGGGPTFATLTTEKAEGAKRSGVLKASGNAKSSFDPVFGMNLTYFEQQVVFSQRYRITEAQYRVKGYLEYGACDDRSCMPPTTVEFDYQGKGPAVAPATSSPTPSLESTAPQVPTATPGVTEKPVTPADSSSSATVPISTGRDTVAESPTIDSLQLWRPVIKELSALDAGNSFTDSSLWRIFLLGLLGGFIALLTPCVWPVIPMTVSFFLKRAKDNKRKGITDAITYGISIIVIYMLLALLITAIYGPQRLNDLATNAPFNIFFCLLLVVFALSFFGWFELTLPSSWANKTDQKASNTSGLLSIFLMAFTLALVSFSCTGPIIGFLLVDFATSSNWQAPTVGMFGFALALALPFTLFALFPTWLQKAPKSGAWMNTVKVTLGFIELAFACKFFSVADMAYGWQLMPREVFLSIWIVIFTALGLYLLGLLRFQSDGEERKAMPVPCIMLGLTSLAFAVYMLPGLWGAPCKAVSAFAPPIYTQEFNLHEGKEVRANYTSYEEGMAAAAAANKPVLLDFTGYGCVNCRKMEAAVWNDREVAAKLKNDYILISLYVDDKRALPSPIEVTRPDGTKRVLRTIGDKWSHLQETKFGFMAQPFYVTVSPKGEPLSGSFGYKESIPAFMDFLERGVQTMKKKLP